MLREYKLSREAFDWILGEVEQRFHAVRAPFPMFQDNPYNPETLGEVEHSAPNPWAHNTGACRDPVCPAAASSLYMRVQRPACYGTAGHQL